MKTIQGFNINTSSLSTAGETRNFTVNGDVGCSFSLEVRYYNSSTNMYEWYNFKTRTYSSQEYSLNVTTTTQSYVNTILFPAKSTSNQYDLLLLAKENTFHSPYREVRDSSGAVDLNNSQGSNSDILQKVIYQLVDGYVNIKTDTSYNSLNATDAFDSLVTTNQKIYVQSNAAGGKISFSISATMADGCALSVFNSISNIDFYVKKAVTLGDPIVIPGEDVYGYGQTARSTDTVDGAVSSSNRIVMDTNVATKMVIGDKVTGTGISSSIVLTVVSLNPDSDNAKEFEVSEAVSIDDGATLTFTEPYHRLWECSDVMGLSNGCFLRNTSGVTTIEDSSTIINDYFNYAEAGGDLVLQNYVPGVVEDGSVTAIVTGDKRVVYRNAGTICVDKAIKLENKDKNLDIYAYSNSTIRNLTGFDLDIINLKTELTPVVTVTTAAVVNSTTVPVKLGHGIMDGDISTVRSPNIVSSSNNDITVSSIASFTSGGSFTASLTLSEAQTLENGETLTFGTAARQVTVTGDINIKEIGDGIAGNGKVNIFLDVDRFLIGTSETT